MYEHSALAEAWEAMIVEILYRQGVDTLCILTTEQSMSDYLCTNSRDARIWSTSPKQVV